MQRRCCKRSMRSSSPHSRTAKKRRWEVLDRLVRLGQGLSPAQMNVFGWFKDAWDARMLQEHGDIWPETFMGWTQRLLGENENGKASAFSVLDHNETRRWGASVASPITMSWPQWRLDSGGWKGCASECHVSKGCSSRRSAHPFAIPRMLSHPTHDMVVTYMHNMACSCGLREFRRSGHAPAFAAIPRTL